VLDCDRGEVGIGNVVALATSRTRPSRYTSAPRAPHAPLGEVVDESDADQILAIEELRSLRDRAGVDAPPPWAATGAAPTEAPNPPTAASLEADADPWEDLRSRATERRRWGRLAMAGGGLALAGGAIAVVMTAHSGSGAPAPVKVPVPAVSAPPVTPSAVSSPTQPAVSVPSPEPSAVLPVPTGAAPSPSAEDTTQPPAAAVPAPGITHRPKPPSRATAPATRHSPSVAPADGSAPGAAPDFNNAPSEPAGSPDPTLTRTPTSWSPVSPP
jgi:hypothetical protein